MWPRQMTMPRMLLLRKSSMLQSASVIPALANAFRPVW